MNLDSMRTYAPCFLPTAVLAAILCASCGGPGVQGSTDDEQLPGERYNGRYSCRGIGPVELQFVDSTGMAYVTRQGRTMQLRQQRSGAVVIYGDGAHSVRRSGPDITVELVSGEPSRCVRSTGPN